ncbi:MAG: aa3-type cytochrome oxidase subunit IV [Acidimicrobiia bacterium]
MRVEAFVFLGVTAFFAVIGTLYWFTSYEDAGTTMLAGCALLGLLVGVYLLRWSRRIPARPEDRPDAALADGAGETTAFPAASIWPFVFGLGATAFATGFVFGVWIFVIGGAIFVLGVLGYVAESRRDH